jgi:probable HAF family extracellular repeat protein
MNQTRKFLPAVILAITAGQSFAVQYTYSVTQVGDGDLSYARNINNTGQIIGGDTYKRLFLFCDGQMQNMGNLGVWDSFANYAFRISDDGQVVGRCALPGGGAHAFVYSDGTMKDIDVSGGSGSTAYGINKKGEIVGGVSTADGVERPFVYVNGQMQDLGIPENFQGAAVGNNNCGQIVGFVVLSNPLTMHACIFNNGQVQDLGIMDGMGSYAGAINDAGLISGEIYYKTASTRAFLFSNGQMQYVDTVVGKASSAYGMNEAGDIVGFYSTTSNVAHGYVYRNGTLFDLNDWIDPSSGWTITDAEGINDLGQIVGVGKDRYGHSYAILLTPDAGIAGDASGDDRVDVTDLGVLAANYGMTAGANWNDGDFNGDGNVDVIDLGRLATNYGRRYAKAGSFVPEPCATVFFVSGAMVLLRRRG